MKRSLSFDQSQAVGGPGSYNPTKPFGHDSKWFVISENRQNPQVVTVGPGEYNYERADSLTKVKAREVEILPYSK